MAEEERAAESDRLRRGGRARGAGSRARSLLLVLSFSAGASGQESGWWESGAWAPADCWLVEGGSWARTASAFTQPPGDDVELAWQLEPRGVWVGEPRVWKDHVLLEDDEGAGRRSLVLVDLLDGRVRERRSFSTDASLAPSVFAGVVVVRSGARQLQAFRLRTDGLVATWSHRASEKLGEPLYTGRSVFVREGHDLIALLPAATPTVRWHLPGNFHGQPSLRGDHLYLLDYDAQFRVWLTVCERDSGELVDRICVGRHEGRFPARDGKSSITALERAVIVRHSLAVPADDGRDHNTTWVDRELAGRAGLELRFRTLLQVMGGIVTWPEGWLGRPVLRGRELTLVAFRSDQQEVLANVEQQPRVTPSRSRTVSVPWDDVLRCIRFARRDPPLPLAFGPEHAGSARSGSGDAARARGTTAARTAAASCDLSSRNLHSTFAAAGDAQAGGRARPRHLPRRNLADGAVPLAGGK